jgi:hypothetical protein
MLHIIALFASVSVPARSAGTRPLGGKIDGRMKKITIQLTAEELHALVALSENQFFRLKYIDPKMPGYKARPEELQAAQSAVHVLQEALRKEKGFAMRSVSS